MFDRQMEYLKENFLTSNEFNDLLVELQTKEIKNQGGYLINIEDTRNKDHIYKYEYNYQSSSSCKSSVDQLFHNSACFRISISIWGKSKNNTITESNMLELFREYWHVDSSTNSTYLPQIHFGDNQSKLQKKIEQSGKIKKCFLCFRIREKDRSASSYKNRAISCICHHVHCNGNGIMFEASDNEVGVLLKYDDKNEILDFAYSIYEELATDNGNYLDIVAIEFGLENILYDSLRSRALDVFTEIDADINSKSRSNIRLNRVKRVDPTLESYGIKLGLIRTFYNTNGLNVFHNIYLDYIAYYISNLKINGALAKQKVADLLNWLNLRNSRLDSLRCNKPEKEYRWDTEYSVSNNEIALAILQGLLKNRDTEGDSIEITWENEVIIKVNDQFIYSEISDIDKESLEWLHNEKHLSQEDNYNRDTVLIMTSNSLKLPNDLFYKVIVVDTHPTSGGGLPDFWAQHLSALITYMEENNNFSNIVLWGDFKYAEKIQALLLTVDKWTNDDISKYSRKTFQIESKIEKFKNKFANRIVQLNDIQDLIEVMLRQSQENRTQLDQYNTKHDSKVFLKRDTDFSNWELTNQDGLRTETLSQAYPMVLDLLRNGVKEKNNSSQMIEVNGRKLYELMNFKIILMKPNDETVPYYFVDEKNDLDAYYSEVYGDEGIFGKPIKQNNQYISVINYVINEIKGHCFSTRRAIIIIPNRINETGETGISRTSSVNPLGLIAIWITPRKRGDKVSIDVSFMWRTVEALIGLPYSLYGSIRFANKVVSDIRSGINNSASSRTNDLQLGSVTYMACSLHMHLDEDTKRIAKGIVNDVSY